MDLRKSIWKERFGDKRIIMWDDTNADIPSPSDAHLNRLTFSHYYGGNVGKGAVFLQTCGFSGTWELFTGGVSDSDYQVKSEILEFQEEFVKECNNKPDVPFTNVLDKGYRIVLAAWRAGKQKCIQPTFARSDRKFNTKELQRSGSVASWRSGNERSVRIKKTAGAIKRGKYNTVRLESYLSTISLCTSTSIVVAM